MNVTQVKTLGMTHRTT